MLLALPQKSGAARKRRADFSPAFQGRVDETAKDWQSRQMKPLFLSRP